MPNPIEFVEKVNLFGFRTLIDALRSRLRGYSRKGLASAVSHEMETIQNSVEIECGHWRSGFLPSVRKAAAHLGYNNTNRSGRLPGFSGILSIQYTLPSRTNCVLALH